MAATPFAVGVGLSGDRGLLVEDDFAPTRHLGRRRIVAFH